MQNLIIVFDRDDSERRQLAMDLIRGGCCVLPIASAAQLLALLDAPNAVAPIVVAPRRDVLPLGPRLLAMRRRGVPAPAVVLVVDPDAPTRPTPLRRAFVVTGIIRRPVRRAALVTLVRDAAWSQSHQLGLDPTPPFGVSVG